MNYYVHACCSVSLWLRSCHRSNPGLKPGRRGVGAPRASRASSIAEVSDASRLFFSRAASTTSLSCRCIVVLTVDLCFRFPSIYRARSAVNRDRFLDSTGTAGSKRERFLSSLKVISSSTANEENLHRHSLKRRRVIYVCDNLQSAQ